MLIITNHDKVITTCVSFGYYYCTCDKVLLHYDYLFDYKLRQSSETLR